MKKHFLAAGACLVMALAPAATAQAATQYLSVPEAKRVLVRFLTEQYGYQPGSLVTYCGRVGWRATVPLRNRITCDVAFDGA